jgi:uncharacterized protein (TIGR02444 family)
MVPLQPTDTPLWSFSLAVYGRDGVAKECLELQERLGLDVNLLLFGAFMGAVEGVSLEPRDIAAVNDAVAAWHGEIVRALRQARRALKPASADVNNPLHEAVTTLRAQVKGAELEAEKLEQAILWQWSRAQLEGRPRIDRKQALAANLHVMLEFYGAGADSTVSHLRDAAVAYSQS